MIRQLFCSFACIVVIGLGGCQKPIEMTSDLNPGQYKVAFINIEPASAEIANDGEYWTMKKLVLAELQKKLPYMGQPPKVGLKITVTHVNTSINAAKAILIGDNYALWAQIQLWDLQTNRQLGKTNVVANNHGVGGLAGLAGHGIATTAMDMEKRLADDFVQQLLTKLYPEKK